MNVHEILTILSLRRSDVLKLTFNDGHVPVVLGTLSYFGRIEVIQRFGTSVLVRLTETFDAQQFAIAMKGSLERLEFVNF